MTGDNSSVWYDAYLRGAHRLADDWTLRGGVIWYDLDAGESTADDFDALALEVSVEYIF